MRIATWNINSVRLRLPLIERLTEEERPDVVCLQETKTRDETFPRAEIERLGYRHVVFRGMKSYNGVAILSRVPLEAPGGRDWCGREDARHIAARLPNGIELHNFYIPAGGDEPDPEVNDKFAHKLRFMREIAEWWRQSRHDGARRIMVGDFNVAPLETDVWSHKQLLTVVSHTPVEVALLDEVMASHDWIDAVRRSVPPEQKLYSWWSYRARDWRAADRGRRLDHIWVTDAVTPLLGEARVLKDARGWDTPSDHAPVVADLDG